MTPPMVNNGTASSTRISSGSRGSLSISSRMNESAVSWVKVTPLGSPVVPLV